ncbi:MAG: hypothetical protein ACKOCO_15135, partial [Bacteroidota bacterium]
CNNFEQQRILNKLLPFERARAGSLFCVVSGLPVWRLLSCKIRAIEVLAGGEQGAVATRPQGDNDNGEYVGSHYASLVELPLVCSYDRLLPVLILLRQPGYEICDLY